MSRHHRERERRRRWQYRRLFILRRDGYQCVKCGFRHRLEVDHIVPIAKGGAETPDNMQTLCRRCHMAKTAEENGNAPPDGGAWRRYAMSSSWDKRRLL